MLVIYPKNAITMKDIDKLTYFTLAGMSVNLNCYNNECSNTFFLLNVAAREIYRQYYDIEFSPSFVLDKIDYVTIDRLNRYKLDEIYTATINRETNTFSMDEQIIGYSALTNKVYLLENINSFTDFTRHSIPCDLFAEVYNREEFKLPLRVTLRPYVLTSLEDFKVNNSKITIEIVDYNIIKLLVADPQIKICGYDSQYSYQEEFIDISNGYTLVSDLEYIEVTSVMALGLSDAISVTINPYIINRYGRPSFDYIQKDDPLLEVNSAYSLDKSSQTLHLSHLNDAELFPPRFDHVETVKLKIDRGFEIDEYTFDGEDGLLYTICVNESTGVKYLYTFIPSLPYHFDNIKKLKSSENQFIKVDYRRDTVNRQYVVEVNQAENATGLETLDIFIKYPFSDTKGIWEPNQSYRVGDLVIYENTEYICNINHTSSSFFEFHRFVLARKRVVSNFILALISTGVDDNTFIVEFDDLFPFNEEAILEFIVSGEEVSYHQILCQNYSLHPIIKVEISKLLSSFYINDVAIKDDIIVHPIENEKDNIILSKIEYYKYHIPEDVDIDTKLLIYKLSSIGKITINGYPISQVFKTFFIDGQTDTLITSDTITQLYVRLTDEILQYILYVHNDYVDMDYVETILI